MVDNHAHLTKIVEQKIVSLWAFPEEVLVQIDDKEAVLTLEQAECLRELLGDTIERAKALDWDDSDPDDIQLIEKSRPSDESSSS